MLGIGDAGVAAVPPKPQDAAPTTLTKTIRSLPVIPPPRDSGWARVTVHYYSFTGPMSPSGETGSHPSKWMANVAFLELDEPFARGRDDGLQLRMHLELLDHMADVPLDGVRGDAEALRHRDRVETLSEQVQDVELSRRELGEELLAHASW
jgi:hypothetical protein